MLAFQQVLYLFNLYLSLSLAFMCEPVITGISCSIIVFVIDRQYTAVRGSIKVKHSMLVIVLLILAGDC